MLHIDSLSATTFKMQGDNPAIAANIYPKNYEAVTSNVYNEAQPRITIRHKVKDEKIAILRKFDEFEINGGTFATAATVIDAINMMIASTSSSSYTVLLNQSGTDAPVATILKDTITSVVLARASTGTYTAIKSTAFTAGKTFPNQTEDYLDASGNRIVIIPTSTSVFTIKTYAAVDTTTLVDDVLSDTYLNIEVYT